MDTTNMVTISMTPPQFKAYCRLMSYILCVQPPRSRDNHIFEGEWISKSNITMEDLKTVQSILDNKGTGSISVFLRNEHCEHLIDLLNGIRVALKKCGEKDYDDFKIRVNERAYNFFIATF